MRRGGRARGTRRRVLDARAHAHDAGAGSPARSACSRATVTCSGWPTTACSSASSRRTARRSVRSEREPSAHEADEHLEILTRAMRSASRSLSTRSIAAPSARSGRHVVEAPAKAALVLAERARHGGLDARRQDRRQLAGRAPQLVHVAFRAREQGAQIGACRLGWRRAPLAQLADAAQGRLARVPQWIVLRVFGVHRAPL